MRRPRFLPQAPLPRVFYKYLAIFFNNFWIRTKKVQNHKHINKTRNVVLEVMSPYSRGCVFNYFLQLCHYTTYGVLLLPHYLHASVSFHLVQRVWDPIKLFPVLPHCFSCLPPLNFSWFFKFNSRTVSKEKHSCFHPHSWLHLECILPAYEKRHTFNSAYKNQQHLFQRQW